MSDPTPTGLAFVSNTGACTTAWPCTLGAIPNGESRTITATFRVPEGYAGSNPLTNTATVSSTTNDPTPANNTASVTTRVAFVAAVNDPNNDDEEDEAPKETEEQRQQRQHTNAGHRGDVTTEGNVIAIERPEGANYLLVTIALTRNETLVVQVFCSGSGAADLPGHPGR